MAAAQTYEQRLGALDRTVEDLQDGFLKAIERLRRTPEAGCSFEAHWEDIARRMKGLRDEIDAEDFDKDQLATLATALLDIRDLLEEDPRNNLDICDQLMIVLERIRHVVRDALDEHVTGVPDDVGMVMSDLRRWLQRVPDQAIADLLGVDRRTLSRWRGQATRPRRELRVFARLVAILRHNWDADGVMAWFDRPRRDLDGRRPASVLNDPNWEDALISAARSGRSQYAT